MVLWIYFSIAMPDISFLGRNQKRLRFVSVLLFLLPLLWSNIQVVNKNSFNRTKNKQFRCVVSEIMDNSHYLFIVSGDNLPLNYFYAWDAPNNYKLENLIYKDRLLTQNYTRSLNRFGITDLPKDIYRNRSVMLTGSSPWPLIGCYKKKYGVDIIVTSVQGGYDCLNVWKATSRPL